MGYIQTPEGDDILQISGTGYVVTMDFTITPYNAVSYGNLNTQALGYPWYSYLYMQYRDDPSLMAFTNAYNTIAQQYLDWFNNVNIPVYANNPNVTGPFLDWVLTNLYGIPRPTLPTQMTGAGGPYNTAAYNTLSYNRYKPSVAAQSYTTTDDIYARIATWNLYKGDGYQFSIPWLKRRIQRFLTGVGGTDAANPTGSNAGVDNTYAISVAFTARRDVTVTVETDSTGYAYIWGVLKAALTSGAAELPYGFAWDFV